MKSTTRVSVARSVENSNTLFVGFAIVVNQLLNDFLCKRVKRFFDVFTSFRTTVEIQHSFFFGELARVFHRHSPFLAVVLVAYDGEDRRDTRLVSFRVGFVDPVLQFVERSDIAYVENHKNGVRTGVVRTYDRVEAFLSCSVPNLHFDVAVQKGLGEVLEVDADRRYERLVETLVCVPVQQRTFSDGRVAHHHDLDVVIEFHVSFVQLSCCFAWSL